MSHAARSVRLFALYLGANGLTLLFVPNLLLGLLGLAPTQEPWIRVLGVIVFNLGLYYHAGAEGVGFQRITIVTRVIVLASFAGLVLTGLAPGLLVLFGLVDFAGAVWTALAMRRDRAVSQNASP
ncbi:hypothetical protein [Niveispirillum sp. KHB5.9]|uniref:hypothetical protein n=1 Tax=Niveispirillum sp. KHB5.9 TaxID=3400269 RepID=UPI003A8BC5B8